MILKNEKVVIVGGSSGMGLATGRLLQEYGAAIVLVGRNQRKLDDALPTFNSSSEVRTIKADMTIQQDREAILQAGIDAAHLVVTAADLTYASVMDFTEPMAQKVVESKLIAPFFLAQAFSKVLPTHGSITFVSGIAAERPIRGGVWTGVVNAGLNAMVRGLAIECSPIRVNTVSPGWVETPLWDAIRPELNERQDLFNSMSQKIPAGRIGQPIDVAQAILSIIGNGFINATTLYIDGGQRLV